MTDEHGYLTMEDLEGMDIDECQDRIDIIESMEEVNTANLKVLKDYRTQEGLKIFRTLPMGSTSFDRPHHTFVLKPKEKTSGALIHDCAPEVYNEATSKYCDMVTISKSDLIKVMNAMKLDTEQQNNILRMVCVQMKPAVVAKPRTDSNIIA